MSKLNYSGFRQLLSMGSVKWLRLFQMGKVLTKFGCSKHLEFPNGVVVNDRQEIFISDNRAHCVKVFNYEGVYLRQIGGEGEILYLSSAA